MKKILLLFVALATTMSVCADEWQQPTYNGSYQPLSTEDTVYIFNTEAKLFLTEGNDWGTHATVGPAGIRFAVKKYVADNSEWDGYTYNIFCESAEKSGWYKMFITTGGNVYVDNTNQEDNTWGFIDLGDNIYNITGGTLNPTWHDYMLGRYTGYVNTRDNIASGTGVILDEPGIDNYEPGTFQITWAFVSQADYASYIIKVETYEAAIELGKKIADAEAMGVTGLDDEKAVFANTGSTKEQIINASNSLEKKVLAYYENTVTPENPVIILKDDCSNPSTWVNEAAAGTFNTNDWIDTTWDGYTAPYLNIWDGKLRGTIYQERKDLPNGIYVVSISALAQKVDGAVFANENQKAVPADNTGHRYKITTEVTDGNLKFGYVQETVGENWVTLDDAEVNYYGSGVEAYRFWLNGLLESAPSFDEAIVMDSLVVEYNKVLASVNTVETKEQILGIIPAYEKILNDINLNITAYETLVSTRIAADELAANAYINAYYADALNDFTTETIEPVLENHKLNTNAVSAITAQLQSIMDDAQRYIWDYETLINELPKAADIYGQYKDLCSAQHAADYEKWIKDYEKIDFATYTKDDLKALLDELYAIEFNLQIPAEPASDTNPIDYTTKIKYPTFDDGANGWINDGWSTCGSNDWTSFADGEVIDTQYLNLWNASAARVYQTLTNLPAGAYILQISAFADADGFEVYANDYKMKVVAGQNEEGAGHIFNSIGETESLEGSIWYGNIYRIAVVLSEDGDLEIGARSVSESAVWAMIDNIKLTYYGTESAIITGVENITASDAKGVSAIYTLSGTRTNTLQRGINIVKMTDGTVRKVMVR